MNDVSDESINIDFDKILNVANIGVRRAGIFMGLGLNAGHDPEFQDYRLTKHSAISFAPNELAPAKIEELKSEFCRWILGNGLRELIETFSVFLDQIYEACTFVQLLKGLVSDSVRARKLSKFEQYGLEKKFKALGGELGIAVEYQDFLLTVNQARNCLTHRRGIIGTKDCNGGKYLRVSWRWREVWAEEENGDRVRIQLPVTSPVQLINARIAVVPADRHREFALNTVLDLSPQEVAEICDFVHTEAALFRDVAVKFCTSSGATLANES